RAWRAGGAGVAGTLGGLFHTEYPRTSCAAHSLATLAIARMPPHFAVAATQGPRRPEFTGETTMRPFRSLLAAALACGALLAEPATAQTAPRVKLSVAQNSHDGVAIDTFAREVEKRTNGRYKIQNFYSGALGAQREAIEGLA